MATTECQYKSWDGSKICREPAWQGSTEGLCIFHDNSKEKNVNLFRKKLARKVKQEDYNFRGYYFPEMVDFADHIFSREVDFEEAIFSSSANFSNSTFSTRVNFAGTTFFDRANFLNTTFSGGAYFAGATFFGGGNFVGSVFSGGAYFAGATFFGGAYFSGTTFSGGAHFARGSFSGGAYFSGAVFSNRAGFSKANFSEEAEFMGTGFSGDAHFLSATFHKWARFEEARFSDTTDFVKAEFLGDTSFWKARFEKSVDFQMATFAKNVSFLDTAFEDEILFEGSRFMRNTGEDSMASALLEKSYRNVKNALLERGNYSAAGEFYYQEMEARRSRTSRTNRLWMTLYKWLCGYGEKPQRVILISLAVIVVSALIFLFNGITILGENDPVRIDHSIFDIRPTWQLFRDFLGTLYYSGTTFSHLAQPTIVPAGGLSRAAVAIEGFLGIFLIILFAVVTARKMIRQ
ncbi:MAG: pentapeptide repeat-containing protein [Theionarchaea archaeon]|nr:pentapeptide repeat-containing protein [Theionarchaea archaeon]MBU7037274.1 pentapeptide repeat-containing protein [Theionarchaea archaeon]